MKIILGSESRARRKILESMGYQFEVMPADIDEEAIRSIDPVELTLSLAHAKSEALLLRIAEPAILITADQVVVYQGTIRGKPTTEREVLNFLKSYNDYPAETVTSVVVTNTTTGQSVSGTDKAKIWFQISQMIALDYLAYGDPFEHAGGFAHEHPILAPCVVKIEGESESLAGLPRKLTAALIKQVLS